MSKKKRKLQPGVFGLFPDPLERYPHTHYDTELNLNWAYKNLGILRDWDMSLTHLILKLAKLHNDDIDVIIKELQKLINLIDSWITALSTALQSYADAEKNGQNHIVNMGQALILLTQTINAGITEIAPIMELVLEGMQNLLKKYDQFFEEINNNISEIYTNINSLQQQIGDIYSILENVFEVLSNLLSNSTSSKILVYGTDYDIEFFNGFEPFADYGGSIDHVPYITSSLTTLSAQGTNYISNTIRMLCSASHPITNTNPIVPGVEGVPQFAHQYTAAEKPESRIWEVSFLNELKNYTASSQSNEGQIWNIRPVSKRASWDVKCALNNDGRGKLLARCVSIADGYNTQYYSVYPDEMTYFSLNIDLYAYYNYQITT